MQIVSVNKIVSRHKNKNAIAEASGVVGLLVIIFDEQPLSPDTNPIVNVIKTGREQQQQHHLQQQLHSGWSVSDLHGTRTWFSLLTCPLSCTVHILSTACTNKIATICYYPVLSPSLSLDSNYSPQGKACVSMYVTFYNVFFVTIL